MKRASVACTVVNCILTLVILINAVYWTTRYDAAPVTAFDVPVPGGNGDFGVDSWRLLSGVWFSIYYFPPQGSLTTILDFTLPKLGLVLLFTAFWVVSVCELFWLAALLRAKGEP